MKKIVLLLAVLPYFVNAQSTLIPDENFEQALIDLALDDVLDGEVLTENIVSLADLNISARGISNLSGIEDFISLESLVVVDNELEELDMSGNPELVFLNCDANSISSLNITENENLERLRAGENNLLTLDLSGNPVLIELSIFSNAIELIDLSNNSELLYLYCQLNSLENLELSNLSTLLELVCYQNELTELDFSENPALKSVVCFQNNIVSLDFSANANLETLLCASNNLEFINMSNGNNELIDFGNFSAYDNPNLYCIQVDNEEYSTVHWSDGIDDHSSFNASCGLGINEASQSEITVYPNPAQEILTVETLESGTYTITSLLGETVFSGTLNVGKNNIDVIDFPQGIYFLKLDADNHQNSHKIIIK